MKDYIERRRKTMHIESKLEEVIKNLFEKLEKLEVGSEEYNAVLNSITKLMDRAIDLEKITVEEAVKIKQICSEETLKKLQIETDREVKMEQIETDREVKMEQIETDKQVKLEQIKSETHMKKQELTDNKKYRIGSVLIESGKIIIPLIYAWKTFKESMYFEKNDTFSYTGGKISQRKLLDPKH